MRWIYSFLLAFYHVSIFLAAPFHPKAAKWVAGRKGWRDRLKNAFSKERPLVWFHCASVGEFEQGRPLIEAFRKANPNWQIFLTFYSPSGYELRKNYAGVDHVDYLPADTANNSRDFLQLLQPDLAIFVKYEFWWHLLGGLFSKDVPTYLVSGIFRPDQVFFKPYGQAYRRVLSQFSKLFVQDVGSYKLLQRHQLENAAIAGDTRFDRVAVVAASADHIPEVSHFCGESTVWVAGSTWPKDEELLAELLAELPDSVRMIIAPHEIEDSHLNQLDERFGQQSVRFSTYREQPEKDKRVLIIDNIGMLSRLYAHGHVAYVGGGFGSGIHNTLEPATFGLPVVFGPKYQKFLEAHELLAAGGAFSIDTTAELLQIGKDLTENIEHRKVAGMASRKYVQEKTGATAIIMAELNRAAAQRNPSKLS